MLVAALVCFALAALGGLTMAVVRVRGHHNPPPALAAVHGLAAVVGVVLLVLAAATRVLPGLGGWALGIFVAAALGGAALVSRHMKGDLIPVPLIGLHAIGALTGFGLLWAAAT